MADRTTPGSDDGRDIDLLFAGDVYCDLVFAGVAAPVLGGEVFADGFAVAPGGVANRAVAAARAGARTRLLSRLGDDPLGRHVHGMLDAEPELDTSWLACVPGHQSPVTVSLTGAEDRSFITYLEGREHLELPTGHGAIGATHVGIAHEVPPWVADLRAAGTTIVGGVGWDPTGRWSRTLLDRLAEVDVFVANDIEATRYTRTDDATTAAKALAEHVPLAVVTCGAHGVVAADAGTGTFVEVPTVAVDVVDPTGAGDVFVATFMAARFATQRDWDLPAQLRFAGLSASVSVTGLGGAISAPRRADLLAFLGREDPAGDWTFLRDPARPPKGLS
jgi:sugar/nucleoside kinase (ribokinase family)